jgi:hypothetical protein
MAPDHDDRRPEMSDRIQHVRNCPANWRGWPITLTEFVPDDAPCTCGAEARAESRVQKASTDVGKKAA